MCSAEWKKEEAKNFDSACTLRATLWKILLGVDKLDHDDYMCVRVFAVFAHGSVAW